MGIGWEEGCLARTSLFQGPRPSLRQTNCPSCGETRGSPPFDRGPVTRRSPLFVESRMYAKRRRRRRYDRGTSGSMGWSDEKGERRGAGSEFDEANVPFFEVGAENFHRLIRENFADLLIRFFNRKLYFSSFHPRNRGVDCRFSQRFNDVSDSRNK